MRQIKFRAYIKSLQWLLPVERICFDCRTVEIDLTGGNGDTSEYDFDEVELMEFTGLKADEKEVYEGDIISFTVFDHNDHDTQYEGVVTFADGRWMLWKTKDSEYYGSDGGFDLYWVFSQYDEPEIIGNIYETRLRRRGNSDKRI